MKKAARGKDSRKENRTSVRHPMLGTLEGRVTLAGTNSPVRCAAVDVSATGLQLLAFDSLPVGTALSLSVGESDLRLEVVWTKSAGGNVPHHVCGVKAVGDANLEGLFARAGLLKKSS